jgi:hypothetical protein
MYCGKSDGRPANLLDKLLRARSEESAYQILLQIRVCLCKDLLRKDESRSSEHQKVVMASFLTKTFYIGI